MSKKASIQPREEFKEFATDLFYRGLKYLSLFVYIVIVFVAAIIADSVILWVVDSTVAKDVKDIPEIAELYYWFKIIATFLLFLGVIIHTFFSLLSQVKFERENFYT